jgi:hypothetical protein
MLPLAGLRCKTSKLLYMCLVLNVAPNSYGRSIAGHANFNPGALDLEPTSRRRQVAVALHEITHALGFSSGKFGDFIRWINATDYQSIDIAEVYLQTTLPGWKTASFVRSPNVQAFVRKHFNCESLPGVSDSEQRIRELKIFSRYINITLTT